MRLVMEGDEDAATCFFRHSSFVIRHLLRGDDHRRAAPSGVARLSVRQAKPLAPGVGQATPQEFWNKMPTVAPSGVLAGATPGGKITASRKQTRCPHQARPAATGTRLKRQLTTSSKIGC